jgi:hypothetical protein
MAVGSGASLRSALPAVQGPSAADQPAQRDDRVGQGDERVDDWLPRSVFQTSFLNWLPHAWVRSTAIAGWPGPAPACPVLPPAPVHHKARISVRQHHYSVPARLAGQRRVVGAELVRKAFPLGCAIVSTSR